MNIKKTLLRHWPLILILALSLVIRVWRLDSLITIGGDVGQDLEAIFQISKGNLTLLGPKIAHIQGASFYLGPAYYYLQIPFVLFSGFDPIGLAIPIILARSITLIFVYLITFKIFGKSPAIFASIIAALSPYWVDKLGYPSYPYLVLPIASAIIFLVISTNPKNKTNTIVKSFSLVILGFLSGLFTHLHYLAISIFLPALIFSFPKINFKTKIILTLAGFLIAVLPQIIFEARNHFYLTGQLFNLLSIGLFAQNNSQVWVNFTQSLNSITYYTTGLKFPWAVSLIVMMTAFGIVFTRIDKKYRYVLYFFIFTQILNLIGALVYFGPTQPHYLAAIYPISFIVTASAIAQTIKINKRLPILLISTIAVFLFIGNNFFSSSGYTMPEDLTLKEIRTISRIISEDVNSQSFNIVSTLDGDSRAMPYRYLLKTYTKFPESVENFDKVQNLYVITRDPARSIRENQLFEISSFQPSNLQNSWEIKGSIRLHKLTKNQVTPQSQNNFIVIINPIRPRHLWFDQSLDSLTNQINAVQNNKLPASWLTSYDNLFDEEIVGVLKNLNGKQEIGAFLEVSEKLATDSRVSYKVADGDYFRPDKVFLSGYSPQDRAKMIKTYFSRFELEFGKKPKIAGSWYFDSFSLNELVKLGIQSTLVVSDQYNTDAARIWGQYFAYPYYPSKYTSLQPARNQNSKIPIVQIQWAQRDPVLSYGKGVEDSRQSFQANDYLNNNFTSIYFKNLLDVYLNNSQTPFNQITIGLEAGQEGLRFIDEFNFQLETISSLQNQGKLRAVNAGEFSSWYKNRYSGVSPSHFLEKDGSFWYMSPYFRLAIFKEKGTYILKDLRFYNDIPSKDYFYKDTSTFLDRIIPAVIDEVDSESQIKLNITKIENIKESFDRLTIYGDNKEVKITGEGVYADNMKILTVPQPGANLKNKFNLLNFMVKAKNLTAMPLNVIKYSKINNNRIFGVTVPGDRIIGINGTRIGVFNFDFQTLSKFKSPSQILEKWQPWIN